MRKSTKTALFLFVSTRTTTTTTLAQNITNDYCADVVNATFIPPDTIVATISSPYETGWDQYADGFRVQSATDGTLLGTRVLGHPHVNEQPFSRSLSGVAIDTMNDTATTSVIVSARDSINGYCGETFLLNITNDNDAMEPPTADGSGATSSAPRLSAGKPFCFLSGSCWR